MTDPWLDQGIINLNNLKTSEAQNKNPTKSLKGFEDNFLPEVDSPPKSLPDSRQYLAALERKLNKIKRDPSIIKQLTEKREECLRNLLNETLNCRDENDLALDAPPTYNSFHHLETFEIFRHIQPIQPLNVGETLHIVKYDQLEDKELLENRNMGRVVDSQLGEAFIFLTNLAWKCRLTLPVLVTAAFMVMDIRLQIEVNIQTRQIANDMDDFDSLDGSDDSWETLDSEDEDDLDIDSSNDT